MAKVIEYGKRASLCHQRVQELREIIYNDVDRRI